MNPNPYATNTAAAPGLVASANMCMPPTVSADVNGEVPPRPYTLRITNADLHTKESNGSVSIRVDLEIISPDVVDSLMKPGTKVQVAGRRFSSYISVTPTSKVYGNTFKYLAKIGVIPNEVTPFDTQQVIADFKQGRRFIQALCMCEPSYMTVPQTAAQKAAGVAPQQVLDDKGQPILTGYRTSLIGHEHLIGPASAPAGASGNPY